MTADWIDAAFWYKRRVHLAETEWRNAGCRVVVGLAAIEEMVVKNAWLFGGAIFPVVNSSQS